MSNIITIKTTNQNYGFADNNETIDENNIPTNLEVGELAVSGLPNDIDTSERTTLWLGMGQGNSAVPFFGYYKDAIEEQKQLELKGSGERPTYNGEGVALLSDAAATVYVPSSTQNITYYKISGFGEWGTGTWYQKGFSMFITSRAGELIWLSLSSDDSDTNARAIRLMNTHNKIANIYYSASENAIYATCAGWNNFLGVHIVSNLLNEYRPTIENVGGLGNDVVEINIIEFGVSSNNVVVGDSTVKLAMNGSETHPTYNGANIALVSDIHTYVEESLVNGAW